MIGRTNVGNGTFEYSNSEQWTGNYWIDGKKIYCKVFTGNSVAISESGGTIKNASVTTDLPATTKLVNFYGNIVVNGGYFNGISYAVPSAYYNKGSEYFYFMRADKDTSNVVNLVFNFSGATNPTSVDYEVCIEYTKD